MDMAKGLLLKALVDPEVVALPTGAKLTMCVVVLLLFMLVGTIKLACESGLGRPWVSTSCSLELTMVAAAEVLGGGIGGGGGGGSDGCVLGGEMAERSMGESVSSVNKSRRLSSKEGSRPVS